MDNQKICVIPGFFDPVTIGHLDIIIRAAKLFDRIYAAAFENSAKKNMFTLEQRRVMLELACGGISKVTVDAASGLLADYAVKKGADFIVKGTRGLADFEYERDMFMINREIGGIDTLFFPAEPEHIYISSSFVREMILYGKDITGYVPEKVGEFIKNNKKSM